MNSGSPVYFRKLDLLIGAGFSEFRVLSTCQLPSVSHSCRLWSRHLHPDTSSSVCEALEGCRRQVLGHGCCKAQGHATGLPRSPGYPGKIYSWRARSYFRSGFLSKRQLCSHCWPCCPLGNLGTGAQQGKAALWWAEVSL